MSYFVADTEAEKVLDEETGLYATPVRAMTQAEIDALEASRAEKAAMKPDFVRAHRNALLAACDWINGADVTMTDEKKAEWVAYRQALRDITSHANWPYLELDDWPTSP